jgi:hypothetical protein
MKRRGGRLWVGTLKVGTLKVGTLKVGTLKVGTLKVWGMDQCVLRLSDSPFPRFPVSPRPADYQSGV